MNVLDYTFIFEYFHHHLHFFSSYLSLIYAFSSWDIHVHEQHPHKLSRFNMYTDFILSLFHYEPNTYTCSSEIGLQLQCLSCDDNMLRM